MMIDVEELQELKDTIGDALAVSQRAEDAAEDPVKHVLSIVNGYLVTANLTLARMIERAGR